MAAEDPTYNFTEPSTRTAECRPVYYGRPFVFDPQWRTETVVALAGGIDADAAYDRLPILADALEEAGCDHADILSHCRVCPTHIPGCWVVNLVLGRLPLHPPHVMSNDPADRVVVRRNREPQAQSPRPPSNGPQARRDRLLIFMTLGSLAVSVPLFVWLNQTGTKVDSAPPSTSTTDLIELPRPTPDVPPDPSLHDKP